MRDEKGGRSGWGRGEWPQRIGEMKKVAGEWGEERVDEAGEMRDERGGGRERREDESGDESGEMRVVR